MGCSAEFQRVAEARVRARADILCYEAALRKILRAGVLVAAKPLGDRNRSRRRGLIVDGRDIVSAHNTRRPRPPVCTRLASLRTHPSLHYTRAARRGDREMMIDSHDQSKPLCILCGHLSLNHYFPG